MNETPTFMKNCITAMREDHKLIWAVFKTSRDLFGNAQSKNLALILDRPKTPSSAIHNSKLRQCSARVWVARHYKPVYQAFLEGKSDIEILKTWIHEE